MEEILHYFPIILYLLGTFLLVIMIILGFKLIRMIDKTNAILDNAYNKIESLNGIFKVIDSFTNVMSSINDRVIHNITNIMNKFLNNKKRKKEIEEDE